MMKELILTTITVLILQAFAIGQNISQTIIHEDVPLVLTGVTRTQDGGYLTYGFENWFEGERYAVKFDEFGNFLWQEKICTCEESSLLYSAELDNGNLIHISTDLIVYQTDSQGRNPEIVSDLREQFGSNMGRNQIFFESDGKFYIKPSPEETSLTTIYYPYYVADLTNSTVAFEEMPSEGDSISKQVRISQSGTRVELDIHNRVRKFEENNTLLWKNINPVTTERNFYVADIRLGEDDNVYLSGHISTAINDSDGFVTCLNGSTGEIIWEYISSQDNPNASLAKVRTISKILPLSTGEILAAGRIYGSEEDGILRLVRIDASGNFITDHETTVCGQGQFFNSLEYNLRGNIFLIGTCGVLDTSSDNEDFPFFVEISNLTDVREETKMDVLLFPNPANTFLEIQSPELNNNRVEIFDLNGKIVRDITGQKLINVADLTTGLYMIKIYSTRGTKTIKWVKY